MRSNTPRSRHKRPTYVTSRSAICTAFSAAPFSNWSPATNIASEQPDRITDVAADTTDQDVVLARGFDRHREVIAGNVVHNAHARRCGHYLVRLVGRDRVRELYRERDRVGA